MIHLVEGSQYYLKYNYMIIYTYIYIYTTYIYNIYNIILYTTLFANKTTISDMSSEIATVLSRPSTKTRA